MQFGSVDNPEQIDFNLPDDHPETSQVLSRNGNPGRVNIYVGCAKWGRKDLKYFYPRGTNDELEYYASQFNAVELNATFYRYNSKQILGWYEKVPQNFRFFPKIHQEISHRKWLSDVQSQTRSFLESISNFMEKRGTVFLQLRSDFKPKFFDRVTEFIEKWPQAIPLAVEFRHTDWYNDKAVADELYDLLEENKVANIITDTAERRDLLHMRLTNREAFIRYVGANHHSDYTRLDAWVDRLAKWKEQGLQNIHFFVHQNVEEESPKLSAYFIQKLNRTIGTDLKVPEIPDLDQNELFQNR